MALLDEHEQQENPVGWAGICFAGIWGEKAISSWVAYQHKFWLNLQHNSMFGKVVVSNSPFSLGKGPTVLQPHNM